jgi:hypothetical protein
VRCESGSIATYYTSEVKAVHRQTTIFLSHNAAWRMAGAQKLCGTSRQVTYKNPLASLFYNCLLNNTVFKACLMREKYFVPLCIFVRNHIPITTYSYRLKLFWIHFKANETQSLLMKESLIGSWRDRSYYTLHFIQHISLVFFLFFFFPPQVSPTHTEILIRHKSLSFVSTYVIFFYLHLTLPAANSSCSIIHMATCQVLYYKSVGFPSLQMVMSQKDNIKAQLCTLR